MSKKTVAILVAVLVLVVAATATITAVVLRGRTPAADQPPPTTSTGGNRSGDGSGNGSDSICGLKPGDALASPTLGATSAKWQQIGQWWLPVSDLSGPAKRTNSGPWSCYTHDQSGAVLAAYVIGVRASGVAEDWQQVTREQTMPGPSQQAHIDAGLQSTGSPPVPKGFDVAAYSEDRATIRYYIHSPQLDAACTANVVWSDGDWKLQLGEDGSTLSGCTQGAPTTFTPWGPA